MSAITEYIHYYQSNYDTWGINRKNTIKSGTMEAAFSQMRNQLRDDNELKKLLQQAQDIEKAYNDLFFPKTPTQFSKMLQEVAEEALKQQFGTAAGKVNAENFNVESTKLSSDYKKKIKQIREKIKIENLKQQATAKQMLNTIDQLSQILLNLEGTNSTVLKNRILQAKNKISQIKNKIKKQWGLDNITFKDDIDTLNKLIQQFNRSFTWYNQRGDLFEWMLPLIKLKGTNLAGDELKKVMKSLIGANNLGAASTEIQLPDFLNLEEPESENINTKKFKMQIVNVRNKTDVIIEFPIENGEYKNINVSAKSVSGKHVKLVDETSLYRVLVFSQNYDFIKHYLNIISWSNNGGRASEQDIINANKLVKALIMQLAAQGFDLNNPAELLIMHNIKEKKINVYNIKALIYKIKEQIVSKNNFRYNNLIKGFDDRYTINQPFEDTVQQRLVFLFNEINKQKITAHIYGTQLNDYLKILDGNIF